MTNIRELFLTAADTAAGLIAAPETAAAWDEPSALAEFSVRGLAGHLSAQASFVARALESPAADGEVVSVGDYYARASWIGSDLGDEFNTGIRAKSEEVAAEGPAALAAQAARTVRDLRAALPSAPDRPVRRPGSDIALTLDDFLTTRLLEIAVHSDDLACSVGVPTPELPAAAVEIVVDVLSRIALRRHGQVAVLRALSRAERAPASVAAI